jgi:2-polyprenyl-6-methoxyphenol hydroxylase-like FAD-dependent oxidoreductase
LAVGSYFLGIEGVDTNSGRQFAVPNLKNYTSPARRVILIGDAAHAIPPTGGQGAAMAFEDAQTLAFVLARFARPTPPNRSAQSHTEILEKWQAHRQARVAEVHAFTTRGGDVRKSAPGLVVTYVKEWVLWGIFKWWGPTGGLRWLYEYKGEDVIGALAA